MPTFYDIRCQACGAKFGWSGEIHDVPPCPKCGTEQTGLGSDQAEIEKFRKFLEVRKKRKEGADNRAEYRKLLGELDPAFAELLRKGADRQLQIPNAETRKTIQDARAGRNLNDYSSTAELFEDLGI